MTITLDPITGKIFVQGKVNDLEIDVLRRIKPALVEMRRLVRCEPSAEELALLPYLLERKVEEESVAR